MRGPHPSPLTARVTKADKGGAAAPQYMPSSARDAVETAIRVQNEERRYDEAVRLYLLAMDMQPTDDEARSAMYNMGCALAKQKQWARATECVVTAINKYQLKLTVALKDDDLRELRERREWVDALMEVKGGLSRNTKIDLRAEARAPFRFPRVVLFGGLALGAATGLVIISFRLAAALQGGEGAPDVQETLQNLAINSVALAILGTLVYRDVKSKEKAVKVTDREEVLGRLQVDLGGSRQLPLVKIRGQVRPVLVSGSRAYVEASLRAADPFYQKLRDRGVSVIPVITDEVEAARRVAKLSDVSDPDAKIRALKKEFQAQKPAEAKGFGSGAVGSVSASSSTSPGEELEMKMTDSDKKWRLTPFQVVEWKEWIDGQKEFASLPAAAQDVYVQVQLDGTVRSSGRGIPNWAKLVDDLPPLDDVRTRMMDGIGTDV